MCMICRRCTNLFCCIITFHRLNLTGSAIECCHSGIWCILCYCISIFVKAYYLPQDTNYLILFIAFCF